MFEKAKRNINTLHTSTWCWVTCTNIRPGASLTYKETIMNYINTMTFYLQVREMMEAHEPFGKPGAGAPNANGVRH